MLWPDPNNLRLFINKISHPLIAIFIISVTLSFTINEGWHESTNHATPGIFGDYLGVAITNMQYGQTGYVGYKEVII